MSHWRRPLGAVESLVLATSALAGVALSMSRVYARKTSPAPADTATIARRQENSYQETLSGQARRPQKTLIGSRSRKSAGMIQLGAVETDKFTSSLVTSPSPMNPHSRYFPKRQEAPHQLMPPHALRPTSSSRILSSLTQLEPIQGMSLHRTGDVLPTNDRALAINRRCFLLRRTTFRTVEDF